MLAVALAFCYDDIACEDGFYSLLRRYCVTAEECQSFGDKYYAYKPLNRCVHACYQDKAAMQCKDFVCECGEGHYLSFLTGTSGGNVVHIVTCPDINSVYSSMYSVEEKSIYAD